MVTSTPKDFQTEANSTPMTPPPSMTTFFGHVVQVRASSEVMTLPPISRPGQGARVGAGGEHDVLALVAVVADRTVSVPSSLPSPSMTVMPLDLMQALQALVLAGDDAVAGTR